MTPITGKKAYAAIADIRPDSPTFGGVEVFEFSENHDSYSLFLAQGLANSICAVEGQVRYVYEVDAFYTGEDTTAVSWDDPDLAISWPIANPVLSDRDHHNPTLRQLFPGKFKVK